MRITYTTQPSPLGDLLLAADDDGLRQLTYADHRHPRPVQAHWHEDAGAFEQVARQLDEYFAGERRAFDVPLSLHGTPFQMQVWQALQDLAYGDTISYGALARRIGKPRAVRALGAAVGRNPVSIVLPCHRVIASNGRLTGYAGGLDRKTWLLRHEGIQPTR